VFFAVAMRSLQLGTYDRIIDGVVNSYTGYIEVHKAGYSDDQVLDNSMVLDTLSEVLEAKISNVIGAAPRVESFALAATESKTKGVFVVGLDIQKEDEMLQLTDKLVDGKIPDLKSNKVLISLGVSKSLGINTNDTVVLLSQGYHGMSANGKFVVSGVLKFASPQFKTMIFMPLPLAQDFFSTQNMATTLVIQVADKNDISNTKTAIQKIAKPEDYEVKDWMEMMPELLQTIQFDSAGGMIMVVILYMVITFGIFSTVLMMLNEREYEFGVLLSIGFNRGKMIMTTVLETFILTVIGVFSGIALTRPIVVYYYNNPIRLTGEGAEALENFGWEPIMAASVDWDIPITHAAVVLSISMVLSMYSIVKIKNLTPVKAMRK
jgi:ABC-type lipoprotein release transport system permease subunit